VETEARPLAEPEARSGSLYPWIMVGFLMILYTSSFIDRTILSLLVKPIRADLNITDTEISLLAGFAFTLFYTVAGIPCGWLVDRWNRSYLVAWGVAIWSVLTASCGLATSFWQLFLARLGVGVGEATLSPAAYSLVSDTFPKDKLGRGLSIYALGIPVGSGLALVIGGHVIGAIQEAGVPTLPLLGQLQPWQFVFMAIGLPGLLLAALTVLVVREPKRHKQTMGDASRVGETIAYLWQNREVYAPIFLGLSFAALFSYGGNQWFPSYLQRVLHFTVPEAGQFMGLATLIFGIGGSMTAGYFADRLIARGHGDAHFRVGMFYSLALMFTGALGPIVPNEMLSQSLIALGSFFSITWVGSNAALLQLVTPPRMRGQVSAIYVFSTTIIGFGMGPTAIAFVTDHVFGDDLAVGKSLALVGFVSLSIAVLVMQLGRKTVAARVLSVRH
jgi:MFS family permease